MADAYVDFTGTVELPDVVVGPGRDGLGKYYGSGAPPQSLGRNGERYVDEVTRNVYAKANDAWALTGRKEGLSAYDYAVLGGYGGSEGQFVAAQAAQVAATQLAQDWAEKEAPPVSGSKSAKTWAGQAGTSASAAAGSATASATSAGASAGSAAGASASALSADGSAVAAAGSAGAAASSAGAASGSAATATQQAGIATTKAGQTAADATTTTGAKLAAEAARDAAVAALNSIFVTGTIYADEATGRAAVANGAQFLWLGADLQSIVASKRVDASTSTLVTSMPTAFAIAGEIAARQALDKVTLPARIFSANTLDLPPIAKIVDGQFLSAENYLELTGIGDTLVDGLRLSGKREIADALLHRARINDLTMPPGPVPQKVPPIVVPGVGEFLFLDGDGIDRPSFGQTVDGRLWATDPLTTVFSEIGSGSSSKKLNSFTILNGLSINPDQLIYWLYFLWGQSLDVCGNSGNGTEPILSLTNPHPGYLLMFDNGQPIKTPHLVANSVTAYPLGNTLLDLREQAITRSVIPPSYIAETRCTAFGKGLIDAHYAAAGWKQKVVPAIAATGGANYDTIRQGRVIYNAMIGATEKLVSILGARGLGERVIVGGIQSMHGQEDSDGKSEEEYARFLLKFMQHVNSDMPARTGQTEPITLHIHQPAREGNGLADRIQIGPAMLRASRTDSRIVVVDSSWHYKTAAGPDIGHLGSEGYWDAAGAEAHVRVAEQFGVGRPPTVMAHAWRPTPTTVRARFNRKVVIDDGFVPYTSNRGYLFDDNGAPNKTVSGATQIDDYTLEHTLSAPAQSSQPLLVASRNVCVRDAESYGLKRNGDPAYHSTLMQAIPC